MSLPDWAPWAGATATVSGVLYAAARDWRVNRRRLAFRLWSGQYVDNAARQYRARLINAGRTTMRDGIVSHAIRIEIPAGLLIVTRIELHQRKGSSVIRVLPTEQGDNWFQVKGITLNPRDYLEMHLKVINCEGCQPDLKMQAEGFTVKRLKPVNM